jgi:SAM-dependent methyltransferase
VGVDYDDRSVAKQYVRGRTLEPGVLASWRAAVTTFLPSRRLLRVLDLGAGSGIFARAWPTWCSCDVVAIEPAEGMRAELVADGLPEEVAPVAAQGERIPLRDASVDVAWLSTVLHHLRDADECARELQRVVVEDGIVLIRGALADRGFIPALEFFPSAERARRTFPTLDTTRRVFEPAGFQLVDVLEVDDMGPRTVGSVLEWLGIVREADSLLAAFTDDEITQAMTAMKARDPSELLPGSTLALVVFHQRSDDTQPGDPHCG